MALAVNYSSWILDRLKPFFGRHILEVGAGSGSFSQMLLETGPRSMTLLEPSPNLFSVLTSRLPAMDKKGIARAYPLTVADAYCGSDPLPTPDTAVYVNVLEHIEDDEGELRNVYSILPENGHLLIFVPANRWLMGSMDLQLGHCRRYALDELTSKCRSAGFLIRVAEYFDVIGILPWWIKYCLLKSDHMEPGAVKLYDRFVVPVSRTLEALITPPVGKSIILAARRQ
jgi:SAM-dependent methyltransferase